MNVGLSTLERWALQLKNARRSTRGLWLYHLEHLAASDHSVNEGHWIVSEDAVALAKLLYKST
jgi:hypothetical protein